MSLIPVFDKYFTNDDAEYYRGLFAANGLHPIIDKPANSFDAIFGNTNVDLLYILRLPASEFDKATKLIEQEIRKNELPHDYYLNQFDNDELYNILKNPKEWSRQDVVAARILLEKRKYPVDEIRLNEEKQREKLKHRDKQKINLPVLILFYIIAPLGALLPVVAGLIIYTWKETDIDGRRDFAFSPKYRQHGLLVAAIGMISCVAWLYYWQH
jgi:hypothetical protein